MTLTVEVTQADIDNGHLNHCRACPVALAICRAVDAGTHVEVHGHRARIGDLRDGAAARGGRDLDRQLRLQRPLCRQAPHLHAGSRMSMGHGLEASLTAKIGDMDWQTISELAMAVTEGPDRLWELLADELKRRLDDDRRRDRIDNSQ